MNMFRLTVFMFVLLGLRAPVAAAPAATSEIVPREIRTTWDPASPVRWDVCQPIEYQVNWTGAPRSARRDLVTAIRKMEAATGIDMQMNPVIPRIPGSAKRLPHKRVIIIGWTSSKKTSLLSRGSIGTAFTSYEGTPSGNWVTITRASVVFDQAMSRGLTLGFGPNGVGTLMLHELGHAVGLGHSVSRQSVMFPVMGSGPGGLSRIDRRALRHLYPRSLRDRCAATTDTVPPTED